MSAEDDHVGEVFAVGGAGVLDWQGFAEDAAGGEDGEDGADYMGGGGEGKVACVVLGFVHCCQI